MSAIEEAFSDARSLSDRILLVRDNDSSPLPLPFLTSLADATCDGSDSDSRGADVGAGPREGGILSCEDSDRDDGESSVDAVDTPDPRSIWLGRLSVEMRGLCMADGTADGAADGCGLA